MKIQIILLFLISNMLLMCHKDKPANVEKSTLETEVKKQSNKNNTKEDSFLKAKKSADYSSLFTKGNDICLSISDMAKATGFPSSSITKKTGNDKSYCINKIKLPNGKTMNLNYGTMAWSKADIQKNINTYIKNKKRKEVMYGMEIELSETGDTYLAHQPLHGRLLMLNANYEAIVTIDYAKVGFKLEEKKKAKKYAVKLANYLLQKHKK